MVEIIDSFTFGDLVIDYSVNRTARKTIGIVVEPDGNVIIKAPHALSEEKIKESVYKKRKWIAEKIKLTQEIKKPVPLKRELVSGEKLLLKNKIYRLKIHSFEKKRSKIVLVSRILHVYVNENLTLQEREKEIEKTLIKWYRKKARNIISLRLQKYAKYVDDKPRRISIRNQKLRWGSCTKDGLLIFNWRIVMAPVSAIDYVIVHEICHLKEPYHSAQFWERVESLFPRYEKWKEWLRINGRTLDLRV